MTTDTRVLKKSILFQQNLLSSRTAARKKVPVLRLKLQRWISLLLCVCVCVCVCVTCWFSFVLSAHLFIRFSFFLSFFLSLFIFHLPSCLHACSFHLFLSSFVSPLLFTFHLLLLSPHSFPFLHLFSFRVSFFPPFLLSSLSPLLFSFLSLFSPLCIPFLSLSLFLSLSDATPFFPLHHILHPLSLSLSLSSPTSCSVYPPPPPARLPLLLPSLFGIIGCLDRNSPHRSHLRGRVMEGAEEERDEGGNETEEREEKRR